MSAGHIDWFEKDGIKFCAIIDDASRKILVAGEFKNANTANSIALVDKLGDYWDIMPLEELISDNGSEFGAHRRNKKEWESRFKRHVESLGIKLITTRIKHPQTNGKIEKFFDCYNMQDDFNSLDDFVYWYNNVRFHESLDTKHYLQTPEDAFWGGLPVEARLGVAFKLFDGLGMRSRVYKVKNFRTTQVLGEKKYMLNFPTLNIPSNHNKASMPHLRYWPCANSFEFKVCLDYLKALNFFKTLLHHNFVSILRRFKIGVVNR